MSRKYKNVYTILEKVKKGELESHYKPKDGGLFGKLNFYKKPDLIKQSLHYLDEGRLTSIMQAHINDVNTAGNEFAKFAKTAKFKQFANAGKKPNLDVFMSKVKDIYNNKFPKHLLYDIYKMYYNKIEKLDFEDRTEKNGSKFKVLETTNNPVGKIMSENSQLKSAVFARTAVTYLISQLAQLAMVDKEEAEKAINGINGNGDEFDQTGIEDALNNMLDNNESKSNLEESLKDAQSLCKKLDGAMTQEQQDQMFESCNTSELGANKLTSEFVKDVTKKIERIKLSMSNIKDRIKKLMDRSISYFSAKEQVIFEDLFNADSIAGLDEFELLHPMLRKIMAEDVMIKETKKIGKIDLYVDVSGSMCSTCGIKSQGYELSKLDFCKSFTFQMQQLNMLNKVYAFNDRVKEQPSDPISIALMNDSGGTNIDRVIEKIEANGINAIVITDAEDRCRRYSDKAFFIGVKGCKFSYFEADIMEKYIEKDQMIIFDGQTIYNIDNEGNAIL